MTASPIRQPLRIAQVAPLFESVPPKLYGGTERVVSYLTEDLVRQGHEVTLFASGDSVTAAQLVSVCDRALRLDPAQPDAFALHALMLEKVFRRAGSFDVIHFHTDRLHLPLARRCPNVCSMTTLHGRLDTAGLAALYGEFSEQPLISISNAQRQPLPRANWAATVHHGLPPELHTPTEVPGRYLAFLGRIAQEKGIERAIAIARRTGIPLKIAAKIDSADQEYFNAKVAPLVDDSLVEFVGEISEFEKTRFLGDALALLFPIDWPEPFGLAMIEAMACGTPVIAFRCGSVPEVIDEGVTGFMVDDLDTAVTCVERVAKLSRTRCREMFEKRFHVARMSKEYCAAYQSARQQPCRLRA
ncbi:MAG: glycosyl transferase group 1 [Gammaproteobacteria bacterium]|nr:glycosyl transferase group 1 [Gammaproteobacteria bacterium]